MECKLIKKVLFLLKIKLAKRNINIKDRFIRKINLRIIYLNRKKNILKKNITKEIEGKITWNNKLKKMLLKVFFILHIKKTKNIILLRKKIILYKKNIKKIKRVLIFYKEIKNKSLIYKWFLTFIVILILFYTLLIYVWYFKTYNYISNAISIEDTTKLFLNSISKDNIFSLISILYFTINILWFFLIFNVFKNNLKFDTIYNINEDKIVWKKHYLVLYTWLFWFYFLYLKWFFNTDTNSDLLTVISIYSLLSVVVLFIINIIITWIQKVSFKNIFWMITCLFMFSLSFLFLLYLPIYDFVKIENQVFFLCIFFIYIIFDLLHNLSKRYEFDIISKWILSAFIVIFIFLHIPSNYMIWWMKEVEWLMVFKNKDVYNFYNDIKYEKNKLNNTVNNEDKDFINYKANEIKYSPINDIYLNHSTLYFQDSKYYYISNSFLNLIKLSKEKYKFIQNSFAWNHIYEVQDYEKQKTKINWYSIVEFYWNVLNSKNYEIADITKETLSIALSTYTFTKDHKIKPCEIKKLFIELRLLKTIEDTRYFNNKKETYELVKNIYSWKDSNIRILKDKLISKTWSLDLYNYNWNYSSPLILWWIDENYWKFLELILLLSNKVKWVTFTNSSDYDIDWIKYLFWELNKCVNENQCDEKLFNFKWFLSKEYIKERYWDILIWSENWWEYYDLKLLKYISWIEKTVKY